ncbi:stress response protein NST1-like [Selaginella moellendorffii]|uniref:stress response protein NST1-like n=1 Tax=Selaginella moellendorffii TaxID=88036 RepID=UPI000D1C3442|nr:stress response protein NST1-like [Selaginella moellendorffii]|eukprot:XP_024543624.1 stress response protein NST1-like [Selaginella moellendorffii]
MAAAAPLDFRFLDEGLGGAKNKKRKRDADQAAMDVEEQRQEEKRQAMDEGDSRPVYGKPSYDGVIAGKVSGRKWKEVKTCRASALRVSVKGSSLEERAKAKRIAAEFRERKQQLKEQIRANKVEKRKRLEEYKKRKEENVKKSGLKLQKVTNLKKLQKMSKKEKKKLVTVAETRDYRRALLSDRSGKKKAEKEKTILADVAVDGRPSYSFK